VIAIIFSKDRPLQLDATIRSLAARCTDGDLLSLHVIYTATSALQVEGYHRLRRNLAGNIAVTWVEEKNFKTDVMTLLSREDLVLWLVDDNIFYRDFSIAAAREALVQHQDALAFSLRLGENTSYCYPLDQPQPLPTFISVAPGIMKFAWPKASYDFGYPLEVSSSLYRTRDIIPLLSSLPFRNPNTLEEQMAAHCQLYAHSYPYLLCFRTSVTFCNPINKVQTVAHGNRAGNQPANSPEELTKRFLAGERLAVERFRDYHPNACHQEIPLILEPTNSSSREQSVTVSIVIPCYNQANFLPEALESVIAQTYQDWECIIVNDGSPDNTSVVANTIMQRHPDKRMTLLEKPNGGLADARNFGISHAEGHYILPLDADDILHPEMLQKSVSFLEANPGVAIIYTDLIHFGAVTKHVIAGEYDFQLLRYANQLNYCSLYKKAVWKAVGGYNTNMVWGYEDWDFWIACGERGFFAKHLSEALLFYRVKSESMFTRALEHDAELKAQIVLNHPAVYSAEEITWAQNILSHHNQRPSPLVSVIVPTHNRRTMLPEAIKSILGQAFTDFEIIVVNDAGEDVADIITELNTQGKIHYIHHQSNQGLAAARNTGIKAAKGKYIAYLDDDDLYYPDHLAKLVEFLESSDYKVAYTDAHRLTMEKRGENYQTVKTDCPYSFDFNYDIILYNNFIPVLCVCHEKSCLDEVGGFDETLPRLEDWDLWIRMSRKYRFAHLPVITCAYTFRLDGSGMVSGTAPSFFRPYDRICLKYQHYTDDRPEIVRAQVNLKFQMRYNTFTALGEKLNSMGNSLQSPLPTTAIFSELGKTGATEQEIESAFFMQKGLVAAGSIQETFSLLAKSVLIHPENVYALQLLATLYSKRNDQQNTCRYLTKLHELNPYDISILVSLLHMTRGRNNHLAADYCRKILELEPDNKDALGFLNEATSANSETQHCQAALTVDVSIIIPVFNQFSFTRQCLEALFATLPVEISCEILIIDNASTDATASYLTNLGSRVTTLKNQQNLGFAVACNQGAKQAHGEYLLFLNNDTLPKPGWLLPLVTAVVKGEADICGARLLYPDGRCQHAGIAFNEKGLGYHIFGNFPGEAPPVMERRLMQAVTGACLLLRKGLFLELGGFDEGFRNGFEDVDLCLRAGQMKKKILYAPESLLVHHAEQTSGRKDHDILNMQRFFERWQGRIRQDDIELYNRFGLKKIVEPDGRIVVSSVTLPIATDPSSCLPACDNSVPARSHYPLIPLVGSSASSPLQKIASSERLKSILNRYTTE